MGRTQFNGHKENDPWKNTQKILFIRHGESEAHVGIAADYIESVRLTLLGKAKAQEIANGLLNAPDRIITSPYLCAWETAYPTRLRFPDTPVEVWPEVREFTYLGSLAGKYLTKQERSGKVIDYWNRYKPVEKDGEGESFVELIERARAVLQKLKKIDGFVVIFTHEQFIRALQSVLEGWVENELERMHMRHFREMLLTNPMSHIPQFQLEER